MKCDPICTDRINSFALVSYIPGALGDFLDGLRKELVAACNPHAHVTLLTPRPLDCDFDSGKEALAQRLDAFVPFQIDLLGVELFASTNVIYLGIGKGRTEMEEMHKTLNSGPLWFDEPYPYHPHVTLAQGLDASAVPEMLEYAKRRWQESAPARSFAVDTLTFVQNTVENRWVDLLAVELTPVRVRR